MKTNLKNPTKIHIDGDFIKLDSLLKFSAITSTGGEAKYIISNGDVFVDDEVCFQRGRKIKPGSIVRVGEDLLLVEKRKRV